MGKSQITYHSNDVYNGSNDDDNDGAASDGDGDDYDNDEKQKKVSPGSGRDRPIIPRKPVTVKIAQN